MIGRVVALVFRKALAADWDTIRGRIEAQAGRFTRFPEVAPPTVVQRLLVSGEDHRHGRHPGFDVIAIGRAVWRRLTQGSHEGASTIEQQIVRVVTGRYERSVERKFREILLAILVADRYPKHILPAVYLAIGYYGWRMNGYLQACRRLGLSPHCPTPQEAARLVARLKYPEPRRAPAHRMFQIERRAKHLRALYQRHASEGTYGYLDDSALYGRSAPLKPVPQS